MSLKYFDEAISILEFHVGPYHPLHASNIIQIFKVFIQSCLNAIYKKKNTKIALYSKNQH